MQKVRQNGDKYHAIKIDGDYHDTSQFLIGKVEPDRKSLLALTSLKVASLNSFQVRQNTQRNKNAQAFAAAFNASQFLIGKVEQKQLEVEYHKAYVKEKSQFLIGKV